MDWQQVTQSFLPLTREQTAAFASPREMDLAIAAYNRAIRNLNQNSADIALIALRKLASDYPRFQEASLLYGCCLARAGDLEEARQQLLCTRQLTDLPSDLLEATDAALGLVAADLAAAASQPGPKPSYAASLAEQLAASDLPPGTAPVVLERTGRRKRMQMASERERRDVMRQSDMPQHEETRVVMPRTSFETVQAVLPLAAVVLVAALLVFLGIRFLPGILARPNPAAASAQERLDYLVTQLEQRAAQDPEMQGLLAEYSQRFSPDRQAALATNPTAPTTAPVVAPTTALAAVPSAATNPTGSVPSLPAATTTLPASSVETTSPSATVASTVATTATTSAPSVPAVTTSAPSVPAATTPTQSQPADAPTVLLSANALYQEGLAAKPADIVRAAEQFNQAIQLLAGIPPETTAPNLAQKAGELRVTTQSQFESVARDAALRLRGEAQARFDAGQVAEALPIYLRAYAINPDSYGGGVAYYCGRCYQLLGQPDQARPYYQFVTTRFAGRDIASSAAARLREMGG